MELVHKRIHIAARFFVIAALMLLLVPLSWIVACLLAAFLHELFHIIAVLVLSGRICRIEIGCHGMILDAEPMSDFSSAICSLAGPLSGLLLCLFAEKIPRIAICGFFQSLYNLLPVYPLDGGRALRSFCRIFFSEGIVDHICLTVEILTLLSILFAGIVISYWLSLKFLPILLAVAFIQRLKKIKFPCKSMFHRVQ